uniref:hypothetical protein n=1 Tax=Xylanibacter caecicola TaxID=2736294 RepID=UPI002592D590
KGKIMVDFNDFINNHGTFGFSYNYGQHFPVGGSFNGSFEDIPLMISIDFGINFDNDKHIIDKVNMQDIMNYDREKKELDTKFFVTVTPQAYFNYFAIGCGFGFLYMDGTSDYTRYSSSSASNTSASTSSSSNAYLIKPMIRPVIKGFIPFSYEDYYISISVGYDWVLGYKKKNGFNVGIGIQCSL